MGLTAKNLYDERCQHLSQVRRNGYSPHGGDLNRKCLGSSSRPVHSPPSIRVPWYVCCGRGYAEEWLDPEDLPKLKKSTAAPGLPPRPSKE